MGKFSGMHGFGGGGGGGGGERAPLLDHGVSVFPIRLL